MRQIEFVNPKKEMKEISEIKSGDMFKTVSDATDLNTWDTILAGTYFTKVESNFSYENNDCNDCDPVCYNAVSNKGILHRLDRNLYVECVNATLTIEK